MITFITGNKNKLREAQEILGEVKGHNVDLPEIQEVDPHVIIKAKLEEARKQGLTNFIIEDTSLYFDALNGLPGPLIKWFLETIGNDGLYDLVRNKDPKAQAKTIIGYSDSEGKISYHEGVVEGKIVAPRGETNFGWDPIFRPDGHDKTFAEMSAEEKNSLSMRKMALEDLKKILSN